MVRTVLLFMLMRFVFFWFENNVRNFLRTTSLPPRRYAGRSRAHRKPDFFGDGCCTRCRLNYIETPEPATVTESRFTPARLLRAWTPPLRFSAPLSPTPAQYLRTKWLRSPKSCRLTAPAAAHRHAGRTSHASGGTTRASSRSCSGGSSLRPRPRLFPPRGLGPRPRS